MANQALDQKIRALSYDPLRLLAFPGNKIDNLTPTRSELDGDEYIVVKTEKHTMDGDYNPAIINAYVNTTYPGALVFADSGLVKSSPRPLQADRAPIQLTVDLAGLENGSVTVQNPDYGTVTGAVNSLLNNWLDNSEWSTASVQQVTLGQVVDEKEMAMKFGIDGKILSQKLDMDFEKAKTEKKNYFIAKFSQIFYTVSAKLPVNPSDVFAPEVQWDTLVNAGVGNDSPPVLIENVQYGQLLFVKFESKEDADKLSAALNLVVSAKGIDLDAKSSMEHKQTLKNVTYSAYSLGGDIDVMNGGEMIAGISDLNHAIKGNTTFSKKSPGYPLYYNGTFLKDNNPAIIQGATEYISTTSEKFKGGNLILEHTGAYVAKFEVYWSEASIDEKTGRQVLREVAWPENGKQRTAPYKTTIALKGNARNIRVKAQGATGLAWEKWRTSVDTGAMALVPERHIHIKGTTLNQKSSVEPK